MTKEELKKIRQDIKNTISDLVAGFLYYDRKEDEELPRGAIERAVNMNIISVEEMVDKFKDELIKGIKE